MDGDAVGPGGPGQGSLSLWRVVIGLVLIALVIGTAVVAVDPVLSGDDGEDDAGGCETAVVACDETAEQRYYDELFITEVRREARTGRGNTTVEHVDVRGNTVYATVVGVQNYNTDIMEDIAFALKTVFPQDWGNESSTWGVDHVVVSYRDEGKDNIRTSWRWDEWWIRMWTQGEWDANDVASLTFQEINGTEFNDDQFVSRIQGIEDVTLEAVERRNKTVFLVLQTGLAGDRDALAERFATIEQACTNAVGGDFDPFWHSVSIQLKNASGEITTYYAWPCGLKDTEGLSYEDYLTTLTMSGNRLDQIPGPEGDYLTEWNISYQERFGS